MTALAGDQLRSRAIGTYRAVIAPARRGQPAVRHGKAP